MNEFEDRLFELRDKAIIRIIDLTSKQLTLQNRLDEARNPKRIQEYQDEIDYVKVSIERNRDIIFHVANLDKEYCLEQ